MKQERQLEENKTEKPEQAKGYGKAEKGKNWCLAEKFFLLKMHKVASEIPKGTYMTSNDFWIAAQTVFFGLIKADCFKTYPNDKTLGDAKCDYRTSGQCKRHWSSSI
jgi:hypothetical protein